MAREPYMARVGSEYGSLLISGYCILMHFGRIIVQISFVSRGSIVQSIGCEVYTFNLKAFQMLGRSNLYAYDSMALVK